jgi:5'-nucleotidase / UDP-sugar diphosphatase
VKGKTGVQTVYDVFAIAPLGAGVVDPTAGSALLTGYFTARELKNILEFFLVDNPAHPGEYFPRVSGLRFRYDRSRPHYDLVTDLELGDTTSGYRPVDIADDATTYSVTSPLYLAIIIIQAIPAYSRGALPLTPKDKHGHSLTSRLEALDNPRSATPELLPPRHTVDANHVATAATADGVQEIKEWQAVMDHMRRLPTTAPGTLPTFPVDHEVRAIEAPPSDASS